MKIAILTRDDFKSPRILAESLMLQLKKVGAEAEILFEMDVLNHLVSHNDSKLNFHYWLMQIIPDYFHDKRILRQLKNFDAVVISECIPNGFWKKKYNVEMLKKIINKPVFFYEVYYLGNAPTQIEQLKKSGDSLFERYDWHLAVSDVTEIKSNPGNYYSCIGLDLTGTGLQPIPKKEFIALVDFKQGGYEYIQDEQIAILTKLNIKTIILEGHYSIEEIRDLYKAASVFFIQFPEAFGLPIAESLACGVQIFTPNSGWPMSWRLDNNPQPHGEGELPQCFTVYRNEEDLADKLFSFREQYDLLKTPQKVFDNFIKNYPTSYFGNKTAIREVLNIIEDCNKRKRENIYLKTPG